MAIIRCTKKILTEIKIKPSENEGLSDGFGSWHCNLLRIDRRKCVLYTHDYTLYSFLVPGLTKQDFVNFDEVFRESLFKNLLNEKLPQDQIERFLDNNRIIEIAKTNNRSVLGSMNDLAFQLTYRVQDMGGIVNTNIQELNHFLNRIPMSKISETYSIYELKSFLGIPTR
jgi:CRISPR/Cas system CSM-associated protein Csm2 small subunit